MPPPDRTMQSSIQLIFIFLSLKMTFFCTFFQLNKTSSVINENKLSGNF